MSRKLTCVDKAHSWGWKSKTSLRTTGALILDSFYNRIVTFKGDIMKYPLASTTWDQSEYDALQRVIDSGMFTMGK